MICLLIMIFFLMNGMETAEQKDRQTAPFLREDDLDSKTKAWLLMVESGKSDEEQVRKITPKSIFIAPLLTSRSNKCKEGYRHDHLGQCVKVIKLDRRAQLEMLLKRLSAMYSDKKADEQGLSEISSGPLHISLPISKADSTTGNEFSGDGDGDGDSGSSATHAASTEMTALPQNDTAQLEYSGSGELNETNAEAAEGSGFEGSGAGAEGDDGCCGSTPEPATLIPEELDLEQADMTTTTTTTTTEAQPPEVPYVADNFFFFVKFFRYGLLHPSREYTDGKMERYKENNEYVQNA